MNELAQPFLEFLIFLFSVFLSFYSPGKLISKILKLKLNLFENIFLNVSLGLVIFTVSSYILVWLKASSLLIPILILILLLNINRRNFSLNFHPRNIYPLIPIFIMSLIFSSTMLTSGQFGESMRFVGINQSDSFWHLSLINELKNNFPPDNPGFAGVPLRGYHFFFNLLLAQISNSFSISSLSLYFHFFPLLFSFLWGLGVYVFMLRWVGSKQLSLLAVFLTFFGGSFSFILRLFGHPASLDDAFGITQPATSLVNPPFSISIILLIALLFSLLQYFKSKNKGWFFPLAILAGSSLMFKVYVGIIIFSGLGVLTLAEVIKKRFAFILVLLGALLILFGTYGVFKDPTSKIYFDPLWSPNRVMEANLPWYGFAEKYDTYTKQGVIKGFVEIEFIALIVFIIGSLGTRIFGLIYFLPLFLKKKIKISSFDIVLWTMTLTSILIPLFFIQSGKVFEMIQMTWYFLFLTSIVASAGLYKLAEHLRFNKIIILFFIILTLPSAYEKINFYLTSSGENLSKEYIESTKFLKSQGNYDSTVLELPSTSTYIGMNTTKEDVNSWFGGSTPKLLALSNKRGYINNEFINFLGVDYSSRLGIVVSIIKYENDPDYIKYFSDIKDTLKNNKISYIYSPKPLLRLEKTNIIQRVFTNRTAFIYKVNL